MKSIYKSNTGQTIFDVALQAYGSLEGLQWLFEDNPDLIQNDGTIKQFGVEHLVRNDTINERMKGLMEAQVPTTGQNIDEGLKVVISDDFGNILVDDFGNAISID